MSVLFNVVFDAIHTSIGVSAYTITPILYDSTCIMYHYRIILSSLSSLTQLLLLLLLLL